MKTLKYLLFFYFLWACFALNAQTIPQNPNRTDPNGKKQGKWTILYDQNWNIIQDKGKAVFYRLISYKDDQPIGKVYDLYANGKVQMETTLIADQPQDVMNGQTIFYRADGSKEKIQIFDKGELIDELNYDTSGKLIFENWQILDSIGQYNADVANYPAIAYEAYHKAKLKAAKEFGKKHPNYILTLKNLGHTSVSLGNYAQATNWHNEALQIQKEVYGPRQLECGKTLMNLSQIARLAGDLKKAESLGVESMGILKDNLEENHPLYIQASQVMSGLYLDMRNFAKGEEYLLNILKIQEKNFGKTNLSYAQTLQFLGRLYLNFSEYALAESSLKESIQIQKVLSATNKPTYALTLYLLASLYSSISQYPKAESLLKEAADIQKLILGERHSDYTQSLHGLAQVYEDQGNYEQAEVLYLESLRIRKEALGTNHPDYAISLNLLGALYQYKDDYAKAEYYIRETLKVAEASLGKNHHQYANYLSNLAVLYQNQGNYPAAEKIYLESLSILQQSLGPEHPFCARLMNNLGNVYQSTQNPKAEELLQQATSIHKKVYGTKDDRYAYSLGNLAVYYFDKKDYKKAEPLLNEALSIQKEVLGEQSRSYMLTLFNLASLNEAIKNYDKAEALYKEDARLWKEAFGTTNPNYEKAIRYLGRLYFLKGDYAQAEPYYKESCEHLLRQIDNKFPHFSQKERAFFISSLDHVSHLFSVFTSSAINQNINTAGWLYDYILAVKGILLNSQDKTRQRILNSKDTTLIGLYKEWQSKRNTLAQVYQMPTDEKRKKGLDENQLEEEINQIERELSKKSELYTRAYDKTRYTWQDVQQTLKPREAAIEIIHYQIDTDTLDLNHYLVLVITPDTRNNPEMLILENGKDLEDVFLKNYLKKINAQKPDPESYLHYWKPIRELLGNTKKVYLSSDGVFHHISFSTLWNPANQKYLLDEMDIQILNTTKDLLKRKNSAPSVKIAQNTPQKAILLGRPQYDLALAELQDLSRNYQGKRGDDIEFYTLGEEMNNIRWKDLPGTEKEVRTIHNLLKAKGWQAELYINQNALEEVIKGAEKPNILHLATHGFFMEPVQKQNTDATQIIESIDLDFDVQLIKNDQDQLASRDIILTKSDPMMLSGLVFTGVSTYAKNPEKYQSEDGILTAFESANLNLDNTELVVLSACQTGEGAVIEGEGVFGLQRGFQVAGAKAILMSLWNVSDEATQALMILFYENWIGKKQTKREAFRNAQIKLRKTYPHPFYWGAFIMIGE
ncbi:MAG: tetratricopeptide repeat protein [Microscillaceae bacterium]|nr:tetratricopeptide repeat protein [Microscillaceae bacterium]